jgi:hypothetical protein
MVHDQADVRTGLNPSPVQLVFPVHLPLVLMLMSGSPTVGANPDFSKLGFYNAAFYVFPKTQTGQAQRISRRDPMCRARPGRSLEAASGTRGNGCRGDAVAELCGDQSRAAFRPNERDLLMPEAPSRRSNPVLKGNPKAIRGK